MFKLIYNKLDGFEATGSIGIGWITPPSFAIFLVLLGFGMFLPSWFRSFSLFYHLRSICPYISFGFGFRHCYNYSCLDAFYAFSFGMSLILISLFHLLLTCSCTLWQNDLFYHIHNSLLLLHNNINYVPFLLLELSCNSTVIFLPLIKQLFYLLYGLICYFSTALVASSPSLKSIKAKQYAPLKLRFVTTDYSAP